MRSTESGGPVSSPSVNSPRLEILRVGIVAGEMSGDILGAGLIKAIKCRYPNAQFEGIGGEQMLAEGFNSFFPMDRLSVMGLVEPLKRLPELLSIRKHVKQHFLKNPPDVFIGIDSPDFTLNIELFLRGKGIKTAHYVSPSVWAWRQGRVKKIRKGVDLMLTLLPFEAQFYRDHDVPVEFVGHPLADKFSDEPDVASARAALNLPKNTTLIAMMPGSRGGEVKLLGPLFFEVMVQLHKEYPEALFVVPAANAARREQLDALVDEYPNLPVCLVNGHSHQVMEAANVILMASGTTTLEAMLLKKPMVVAYKLAPLSYSILIRIVKTPFYALPNLLAGKALVPELIQENATVAKITTALSHWLSDKEAAKHLTDQFHEIHHQIRRNASERAAAAILALVETHKEDQQEKQDYT